MPNEPEFPESEEVVRATLLRVLELKGHASEAQLLRMAELKTRYTDHDNWNGGIEYFTVELTIPLEVFVQIEAKLEEHEGHILNAVKTAWRDFETDVITGVRFIADRQGVVTGTNTSTTAAQLPPFWDPGHFRLFLSHCSSRKAQVGQLKLALANLGVSAFVAHDDIEPSLLWQSEIEKALRTCEALAAIVTDDFITSTWCDQEVGFALGRGVPVLPIQWGKPPHGFIGKIQALPVPHGASLQSLAGRLLEMLLVAPQTAASATTALVQATVDASSFASAKSLAGHLETAPTLSTNQARALREAMRTNSQVRDAFGVPERISAILSRHGV